MQLFPKGLPRSDTGIQLLKKYNQQNVPPRRKKKATQNQALLIMSE